MPENSPKRALIFAVLWTLATAVMAAGIIWALPGVAPMPALVFGLCAVCAICWWGTFIRTRKPKK